MKYILLIVTFITSTAFAQFDTKSIETKVINGMFGFTYVVTGLDVATKRIVRT